MQNVPLRLQLLWLRLKAGPHAGFTQALEKRLRAETESNSSWFSIWKWVTTGVVTAGVAMSGTGMYAYASDEVLPSHPLYGLRQGIEALEESTAIGTSMKERVHQRHEQRRAHEQELIQRSTRTRN